MGLAETLLLALALAMDAFAVSVAGSLRRRGSKALRRALPAALSFGLFQAVMPAFGWGLGRAAADLVAAVDHWIAFGLLFFIGAKMVREAVLAPEGEPAAADDRLSLRLLLALSVATSVDAAAAGVSLALTGSDILRPALVIGLVTFALSWAGGTFGAILGERGGSRAEIAGGLVLIALGAKILVEHLSAGQG